MKRSLCALVFAWSLALGVPLGLLGSSCAHPRHTAVIADVALYESLNGLHAVEQSALCGLPSCAESSRVEFVPGWTLAKSQAFNQKLLPAVQAGRQFNILLRDWKPGTPMPAGLSAIIVSLSQALTAVTQDFPDGTTRAKILASIASAQQIILDAIAIYANAIARSDRTDIWTPTSDRASTESLDLTATVLAV